MSVPPCPYDRECPGAPLPADGSVPTEPPLPLAWRAADMRRAARRMPDREDGITPVAPPVPPAPAPVVQAPLTRRCNNAAGLPAAGRPTLGAVPNAFRPPFLPCAAGAHADPHAVVVGGPAYLRPDVVGIRASLMAVPELLPEVMMQTLGAMPPAQREDRSAQDELTWHRARADMLQARLDAAENRLEDALRCQICQGQAVFGEPGHTAEACPQRYARPVPAPARWPARGQGRIPSTARTTVRASAPDPCGRRSRSRGQRRG